MTDNERLQMRLCAVLLDLVREGIAFKCPEAVAACENSGELFALDEVSDALNRWADGEEVDPDLRAIAAALSEEEIPATEQQEA